MKLKAMRDFSSALAAPPPMATPSALKRYGVAAVAVLVAAAITFALWPVLEARSFLLLLGAVAAGAWYGGSGPGLLAAGLSAAVSHYLVNGYTFRGTGPENLLNLVMFIGVALFTSWLATTRLRAEGHVREQWEFCRVTLTSIGDAVIVINAMGKVTFMNGVAQTLTGWGLKDAFGRALPEIFNIANERTRQSVESPFTKAVREGVVVGLANHTMLIAKDGTERPIDDSGAPIRDRTGEVVGVVLVFRDVTERKRGEEERAELLRLEQAARAQAEAANRAKDEFLATVSHELRTPLTAILGWARLVRTMPLGAETAQRGLETIERNAKAQATLIDDLLDMSRIVTGRLPLDVRPVDLVSVIDAVLDTLRPAADAKGIDLRSGLDPTAGPVLGDAARLQQVVWNLLSNAIKFTPKAGWVEARLRRVDSNVVIEVEDSGRGIRPEFLPLVFDRFTQGGPRETASRGGLGLGLAIVRHLVELHGGTVHAESAGPQQGATFRVTLPLPPVVARAGVAADVPASAHQPVPLPDLAGVDVLVVEDQADAQELIRTILEACRATVRIADATGSALDAIARQQPDVIVSDIGLPGEDGYVLIRRVRALDPDRGGRIPAVALTAYASQDDTARALSVGFQAHVAKPVEPGELAAVVARLAGRPWSA